VIKPASPSVSAKQPVTSGAAPKRVPVGTGGKELAPLPPPPHVIEQMRPAELFDQLDRDASGQLDLHEVPSIVLSRADVDVDEELTLQEFRRAFQHLGRKLFAPPRSRLGERDRSRGAGRRRFPGNSRGG